MQAEQEREVGEEAPASVQPDPVVPDGVSVGLSLAASQVSFMVSPPSSPPAWFRWSCPCYLLSTPCCADGPCLFRSRTICHLWPGKEKQQGR